MRSLPGQLSLFELDAGGEAQSTVAEPSPRHARVEIGADRHPQRARPGADPRSSRSPEQVTDRSARKSSPVTRPLLSPEDVARRCSLSRKAVYRAVARGELRAARILSRLRIDPGDVEAWLHASIVEPERPPPAPIAARSPTSTGLRRLLPGT